MANSHSCFGRFKQALLADGYDWLGAEVNAADCAELARLGLPHRHVDGRVLPFSDASFDAALCLEVLEHIEEPRPFLARDHFITDATWGLGLESEAESLDAWSGAGAALVTTAGLALRARA